MKESELILYGGEFYNGNKVWSCKLVFVLCDLYVWNSLRIVMLSICVIGLAQTFVYGDLYRYDVEKQDWKLISSPNSPPPRSAHQAVAWKNYLYIFGKTSKIILLHAHIYNFKNMRIYII